MKRVFCLFYFCLICVTIVWSQDLTLIPEPQSIQIYDGRFDVKNGTKIQYFNSSKTETSQLALNLLKESLIDIATALSENIFIGIPNQDPTLLKIAQRKEILPDTLGKEGFILLIESDSIFLTASTSAGLLYGVYAFRQILQQAQQDTYIPSLKIIDYPAFEHRGVMDDISRGPLSNISFIKKQIRRLSELRINRFHFYIEHVVKTKKHAAFAPEEGISISEWHELSNYAKVYNIELIGGFQSLGHFRNILSHPKYRSLGISDRMLEPGNPQVIQFLTEVYEELIPAFSSDYFNINADEAWDLARGKLKPLADSLGAGSIYASHVKPLLTTVLQNGKIPMMWGDMALQYLNVFDAIPKETTILTWVYEDLDSFNYWIDPIVQRGFEFWVCPGILNSDRVMPDFNVATKNIQNLINQGHSSGAAGVLLTIWDDGGRHFFSRDWYGVAYGADQSWNPTQTRRTDFDKRFSKVFYQDENTLLPTFLHQINELSKIPITARMSDHILKLRFLPEANNSIYWNTRDDNEMDSILAKAEKTLNQIQPSKANSKYRSEWESDLEYWVFTLEQYKSILSTKRELLSIRDHYRVAINENSTIHLHNTLKKLSELQIYWIAQRSEFERLWQKENRAYWLNEALSIYDQHISAFAKLRARLKKVEQELPNKYPDLLEIGLDIHVSNDGFFTYWLMAGAFSENNMSIDFLKDMGGENIARPTPGNYFTASDGRSLMWQKVQSTWPDRMDFKSAFDEGQIAYAYCRIQTDTSKTINAIIESQSEIQFFLNGELIHQQSDYKPNPIALYLNKGQNYLLLKVKKKGKAWSFSFRIPDYGVINNKYRYQLIR